MTLASLRRVNRRMLEPQFVRNIKLGHISRSKLKKAVVGLLNGFADGFFGTDGISGSSVAVDSTNAATSGFVQPTAAASTSSYANAGGTGNRTSSITVSSSGLSFGGGSVTNALVNGNQSDQVFFGTNTTQTGYIQFDFGAGNAKYIDEVKIYKDTGSGGLGTGWKWQGSNDGSTWTDLTGSLTLTGSASTYTTTIPAYNTTYRYFRFILTAGTFGGSWVYELEFKLSASAPGYNAMTLLGASRTADATVKTADFLAEVDLTPDPSVVLNTDITAEVQLDNATWTPCTLINAGKGDSGHTVLAAEDVDATDGTSFTYRIKNPTNKTFKVYGVEMEAAP